VNQGKSGWMTAHKLKGRTKKKCTCTEGPVKSRVGRSARERESVPQFYVIGDHGKYSRVSFYDGVTFLDIWL
jgi:hypothetical protein